MKFLKPSAVRLNKFIAQCTGISRREADRELEAGRILVNGVSAALGQVVDEKADIVVRRGQELRLPAAKMAAPAVRGEAGSGHRGAFDFYQ